MRLDTATGINSKIRDFGRRQGLAILREDFVTFMPDSVFGRFDAWRRVLGRKKTNQEEDSSGTAVFLG